VEHIKKLSFMLFSNFYMRKLLGIRLNCYTICTATDFGVLSLSYI